MNVVFSHQWNTGRVYTKHGQRIAAEVLDDLSVRFFDADRGIGGVIDPDDIVRENEVLQKYKSDGERLRDYVMYRYDYNKYRADYDWGWHEKYFPKSSS